MHSDNLCDIRGAAGLDLCVVVPAFNEQDNLPVLIRELAETLGPAGIRHSVLVVDDGSRDSTPEVLRSIIAENANVSALRLSRNFGHQAAISTGLRLARGRAIAIMDADLQDRPSDLVALFRAWQNGADVAYAVRRSRREGLAKRIAYKSFYRLLAAVSRISIPLDAGDFCVMDARLVDRLNALPERLRFVRGLRAWLGGRQVAVAVDRDERRAGRPQYTFGKLMRLGMDGVMSFSDMPLRLASLLGILISVLAFVGSTVVLFWKLTGRLPSGAGLATIALAVMLLGGIQLLTIGILGEYIGRIFEEVKARPIAVVGEQICGAAMFEPAVEPEVRWADRQVAVGLSAEVAGDVGTRAEPVHGD